jgi:PTS system nitrogen regulatory IIA component
MFPDIPPMAAFAGTTRVCGASPHAFPTPRQTPLPLRLPPSRAQEYFRMPFLDLLPLERVRTDVVANDKETLIAELAALLAGENREDIGAVQAALEARERLGSTGLGHGVAIPHGRSPSIAEARAAFVRLERPIDFGADDRQPVDLVAALIVPAHFTDQHLKLLAELAELFSDAGLTARLRAAPDAAALRENLRTVRPPD